MGSREFNPLEMLIQLEPEARARRLEAMRSVLFYPCADVYETDVSLIIKMELAGVAAENLNIVLTSDDRSITVSGRRAERSGERSDSVRCYQLEIFYGEFSRDIALPPDVAIDRERITATFQDGFLEISLPKRAHGRNETRIIAVKQG